MYYNYNLWSVLKRDYTYVEFGEKNGSRLFDYFLLNSIDGKFLQYIELKAVAQERMKESDLDKCDFLDGLPHLPIFLKGFIIPFLKCWHRTRFFIR